MSAPTRTAYASPPTYTLSYEGYFNGELYNPNPNWVRKRLVVESNSVAPEFKVLLYPFELGTDLPVTNWNATRDTLEVNFPNEQNLIAFSKDADNNTRFQLVEEVNATDNRAESDDLLVYPNPSSGNFWVDSPIAIKTIDLLDLNGKRIRSYAGNNRPTCLITTNNRPADTYLLKITTSEERLFIEKVAIHP